jgi:hypothetical protein
LCVRGHPWDLPIVGGHLVTGGVCLPDTILVGANQPINILATAVQRGQRSRGASIAYGVELCWAVKIIARAMPLPAAQWSDEHAGQNYGRATRKTSAEPVVAAGGQSDEPRNVADQSRAGCAARWSGDRHLGS